MSSKDLTEVSASNEIFSHIVQRTSPQTPGIRLTEGFSDLFLIQKINQVFGLDNDEFNQAH